MAPPKIQIPPEILERAKALYENGMSNKELGRLMGVSDVTVRSRAVELGWSRARRPKPGEGVWPDAPPLLREPTLEEAAPKALRTRLSRMVAREMLRAETYNHSPAEAARARHAVEDRRDAERHGRRLARHAGRGDRHRRLPDGGRPAHRGALPKCGG